MNEFIKLTDIIKIWPTIILCNLGNKILLKDNHGLSVLKSICKIIERNNSRIDEMINGHPRVFSYSIIMFYLLSRKHPSDKILKELVEKGKHLVSLLSVVEKDQLKIKMKTFLTTLEKE